jgi:hypothetical protein
MPNPDLYSGSEEEWQELLGQLRRESQTQPQPFFYTRVQARLAAQHATPRAWLPSWLRRPAYVALLGILVLAVSGDGAALQTTHPSPHSSTLPR